MPENILFIYCVSEENRSMLIMTREVLNLPRGKELEQLPMANTLPGAGKDTSKMNRTTLSGMTEGDIPKPAQVSKKNK
jgi:hypothetical protein